MRIRRRYLWTIAVAIVAVVLALLLVLIATGILVLPSSGSPAPVSVTSVQFTVLQGTNASGLGWLGPSTFNYSGAANGYPFKVAPGATFSIPIEWRNYDGSPHTLYSITAQTPFAFSSSSPALPATLTAYQDDAFMQVYVTAPNSAGASLTLFLTVNAYPPS